MSREIRLVQFLMLGVALASAQTISGDLVVKVVDPSGAVVANSKLTLTEIETKVKAESVTDTLGDALFFQLKPGQYELEGENHDGFGDHTLHRWRCARAACA